jgi:methanol--5-hydroxybenzimidazolylcobamide Co-methyltransferase
MEKFTSLAIADPQQLIFGKAPRPVECGHGLKLGGGEVVPEINYTLPTMQVTTDTLPEAVDQFCQMARSCLQRSVELQAPAVVLEFEHVFEFTENPEWGRAVTEKTREIMEEFHDRDGIRSALRVTVADIRDRRRPPKRRSGDELEKMLKSFELCARGGAHMLAIESTGGKEVSDRAMPEGDLAGCLFGVGYLGGRDMEFLWDHIVRIARDTKTIPSGDTDCAHANTAMRLANMNYLPHVLAAVMRAVGAARSIVAYERGAVGPSKDCAYEGPVMKAIAGVPISMEGKTSACAHSSHMGNIAAAAADLWSNESVQNVRLLSGFAPEVFSEMLIYDCRLMNQAIKEGRQMLLRDLLVNSDIYRNPQALMLAPDVCVELGQAIVSQVSHYQRARAAALIACEVMRRHIGPGKLSLPQRELQWLDRIQADLEALPEDEEKFAAQTAREYSELFELQSYGL